MLTIRMNEPAASALNPLTTATISATGDLHPDLRDKLSEGLAEMEGALVLAAHNRPPRSPTAAMRRTGWPDLTFYECQANSFHLDDYAPIACPLEDGQPRISHDDQVVLLRLGLAVADAVRGLVRALPQPVPVRCIISANDTNGTFRFHRLRNGEQWGSLDLDEYRQEMLVVVDEQPS